MDVIELFRKHLSFSGRASRLTYWKYYLFDTIVSPLLLVSLILLDLGMNPGEDAEPHSITVLLIVALLIFTSISLAAISVRRLHDLDLSGWYYIALMTPIYGWYLGLLLGFKAGTEGPNQYGPDPRVPKPTRTLYPTEPLPNRS